MSSDDGLEGWQVGAAVTVRCCGATVVNLHLRVISFGGETERGGSYTMLAATYQSLVSLLWRLRRVTLFFLSSFGAQFK